MKVVIIVVSGLETLAPIINDLTLLFELSKTYFF